MGGPEGVERLRDGLNERLGLRSAKGEVRVAGMSVIATAWKCDACGVRTDSLKGWFVLRHIPGILKNPLKPNPPRERHYCSKACAETSGVSLEPNVTTGV